MEQRNREALHATAALFDAEKYRHNQGTWCTTFVTTADERVAGFVGPVRAAQLDCGSELCVAGHACVSAGARFVHIGVYHEEPERLDWVVMPGSTRLEGIADVAMKYLGLSSFDREVLFHPQWEPAEGMSVAEALRALGDGATMEQVSSETMQARIVSLRAFYANLPDSGSNDS